MHDAMFRNITIRTHRFRNCTRSVTYRRLIGVGHFFDGESFGGEEIDAMLRVTTDFSHRVRQCRAVARPSTVNDSSESHRTRTVIIIVTATIGAVVVIFLIRIAKKRAIPIVPPPSGSQS